SFLYAPYVHDGPVLCPLRLVTGIPCPACGLTRSFCALASGRPADAFAEHLLGPLAFFFAGVLGVAWSYEVAAGRRVEWLQRLAYSKRVAWTLGGGILAYYVVRMVQWGWSGDLAAWIRGAPCGHIMAWVFGGLWE
ncbi:MAG: DUF2752 domain-containing protein, partial [Planctomycetota bacterium]|nr:DUF2752 domain-containing protein [Planctomycetota bacterium]